jgi:chromosome segregation ATPase
LKLIENSRACTKELSEVKEKKAELEKYAELYEESERNVKAMEVKIQVITEHYDNVTDVNGVKTIDAVLSNAECNATVSRLTNDRDKLSEKIVTLKSEISDKQETIEDNLKNIEAMNGTINKLEVTINGLKGQIEVVEQEKEDTQDELTDCTHHRDELELDQHSLEQKNSKLEADVKAKDAKITDLMTKMTKLNAELRDGQQSIATLDGQNKASQEKLKSSENNSTIAFVIIGLLCLVSVGLSVLYYRERERVNSFYKQGAGPTNGINGRRNEQHLIEEEDY